MPDELASVLMARLLQWRVAGRELSHSRQANLVAIDKLLAGEPFYTLGIDVVTRALADGTLSREGVLAAVAVRTGCSRDPALREGPNYISPRACLEGLWRAARLCARVRQRGGTVVFGTGHPGTMAGLYGRLAEGCRAAGCRVPVAGAGTEVQRDWVLDFVGPVACVSDTCSLHHTHMTAAMEAFLDALPAAPDLAFCDHGFAGACLNRGVPCIVPMDTNDPALAVADEAGVEFVLVPMNDNLPNHVMAGLADVYEALMLVGPTP
ncbi:MAG: phosphatase [Candidatus Sericytochromatia bacterium]|nr:phosphatase [Candidatus Sericytochromatia bacterium]